MSAGIAVKLVKRFNSCLKTADIIRLSQIFRINRIILFLFYNIREYAIINSLVYKIDNNRSNLSNLKVLDACNVHIHLLVIGRIEKC